MPCRAMAHLEQVDFHWKSTGISRAQERPCTPVSFSKAALLDFVSVLSHASAWECTWMELHGGANVSILRSSCLQRQNEQNIVAACERKPDALQLPSRSAMSGATLACIHVPLGWLYVGISWPGAVPYLARALITGSRRWDMVMILGKYGEEWGQW